MALQHALFMAGMMLPCLATAQDDDRTPEPPVAMELFGLVQEPGSGDPIPSATIRLVELPSGEEYLATAAGPDGQYSLTIQRAGAFKVTYSGPGRMDLVILVDLLQVPAGAWENGQMGMEVNPALWKADPRLTDRVFYEPARKCSYNLETEWLEWDDDYQEQYQARVEAACRAVGVEPPGR